MDDFLSGLIVAFSATAALTFWTFWLRARDRLFVFFSVSFLLLAMNYILLTFNPRDSEVRPYLYLVRLAAFVAIIVGIVDKNRERTP